MWWSGEDRRQCVAATFGELRFLKFASALPKPERSLAGARRQLQSTHTEWFED